MGLQLVWALWGLPCFAVGYLLSTRIPVCFYLNCKHTHVLSKFLDVTLLSPADAKKHTVIAALNGVPEDRDDSLVDEI